MPRGTARPSPSWRRRTALALVVVLLLAAGAGVASLLSDTLGLTSEAADVPQEGPQAAPVRAAIAPPRLDVIAFAPGSTRVVAAATALADALDDAGAPRPSLVAATDLFAAVSGKAAVTVHADALTDTGPEAYRITADAAGQRLDAATTGGAATALRVLADRVRSGRAVFPDAEDGVVVTPRLATRLVDTGAVGFDDDPARFAAGDDYTLNTDVVGSAVLPDAPYVDAAAVEEIAAQFRDLVDHSLALGYNGVVVPGFLEYVTFRDVGDGHEVYPVGDTHPERAEAMVEAFGPVWRYAYDQGMKVYFSTDMLAVSPPLARYLESHGDGVEDPASWTVYQAGLRELFAAMPFADGLMVRVGEGGSAYAMEGWDYSSELAVTTPAAVRTMLRAFLEVAGDADRDVIFRSWTVGVGPVGDLHTNPDSYDAVLGDLDDPHLVVSTKYVAGDFYSHLPLNATLERGPQRRIVELQARREFEGLGSLPNDLGAVTQEALQRFLAANPQVEGVWTWTQIGGPLYAGPRSLYLRDGFWQLYDLNAYVAGRLALDPTTEPGEATADWVRQTFSADPETVRALGEAFALSRAAISDGLYLGPYADRSVKALGLEPPPMMWIFEWDLVTGDSASLDSIYAISRGRLDEAVAEGERATRTVARMRTLVEGTDAATWRDAGLRTRLLDTLAYEEDLFRTLAAYRATFLRHVQWLDTGSERARTAWHAARERYEAARAEHVARYADDLDLPAYSFTPADLGSERADRDPGMALLARGLLVLVLLVVAAALTLRRRSVPGLTAVRALLVGVVAPWRLRDVPAPSRTDRVAVWLFPALLLVASRAVLTWFAAPAHLLVTLGAWVLFALAARLLVRGRDPYALWAAIGGVAILRTVVLLLALARRGPGRYWFLFWTDPDARTAYVTLAFAAFCWLFVATWLVLRHGYGLRVTGATGRLLVALGVPLVVLGGLVAVIGLEQALTVWNDQMALLPWGLSRILGITVYLGIPTWLPAAAAALGAALAAAGGVLLLAGRHGRAAVR
ncbi:hypothetical protein [Mumia sp. DW29H23]|uniref:hypothetical protein n=1 Tax=Mumia sp. DW29H23 TaxID=3421241 RepID=UPI003D6827BD